MILAVPVWGDLVLEYARAHSMEYAKGLQYAYNFFYIALVVPFVSTFIVDGVHPVKK